MQYLRVDTSCENHDRAPPAFESGDEIRELQKALRQPSLQQLALRNSYHLAFGQRLSGFRRQGYADHQHHDLFHQRQPYR